MKLKQLLTKTLLVAVCLFVGASNAWAQVSTWTYNATLANNTIGSAFAGSASGVVSVTLGADGDGANWQVLKTNSNNRGLAHNTNSVTLTDNVPTAGTFVKVVATKKCRFVLGFYRATVGYLVMIDAANPSVKVKNERNGGSGGNKSATCELEAGHTYYIYYNQDSEGGNFSIQSFTATSYEDCTINYTYGEETITSEVVSDYIGSTVNATMTSMWDDGATTKYYVADDATTSFTVAESGNTFKVKLRLAATDAVATVNAVDGSSNVLKSFTATGIEGETKDYIFYTRAVLYNGQYYVVPAANGTGRNYAKANVVYGGDPVTVTYTLDETITYYAEEKDLILSRAYAANGDAPERASGGNWSRFYRGAYARTAALEAGVYTLEVSGRNQSNDETLDIKVYSGSALGDVIASPSWSKAGNVVNTVNNILVPEGGSIAICNPNASYNSNIGLDYVIVRKVYDIEGEVVGKVDYSTSYSTVWNTTPIWINAGETAYYKFKNYNNTSSANLYENWYLFAANESSTNLAIFGPNHTNTADGGNGSYTSKPTFTMSDLNGATVELTATLADAGDGTYTLTVTGVTTKADGSTTLSPNLVYTQKGLTVSKLKLYISPEKNWLELLQEAVLGTVTSAGWSTFASSNALDLSTLKATSDATAYYASAATGNTVTLKPTTDKVPAGEGIMVKGTAGETFTIDVTASGTAIDGNLLKGQTTTGNVAASTAGTYHYVFGFSKANASVYGFYNLASDTSVPAGKAYLETNTDLSAGARSLSIVFDDEVTGIENLTPALIPEQGSPTRGLSEGEGAFYDLQGRRVAQPTKGLYIVNGKKVMIK